MRMWKTMIALGLLALGVSGALAQAPKTFNLKFNHVLGPKEPYHEGYTRESMPFLIAVGLVTLMLVFVPEIVLFVPDLIFGKD